MNMMWSLSVLQTRNWSHDSVLMGLLQPTGLGFRNQHIPGPFSLRLTNAQHRNSPPVQNIDRWQTDFCCGSVICSIPVRQWNIQRFVGGWWLSFKALSSPEETTWGLFFASCSLMNHSVPVEFHQRLNDVG